MTTQINAGDVRPRARPAHVLVGLLTVGAGLLCSFGFTPVNFKAGTIMGIALLILVLRAPSVSSGGWRLTAFVSTLFAMGFMGPLLWWMTAVSFAAYVALLVTQTVFVALAVLAVRAVITLRGWPVWAATVWVGFEYLRSSLPFGGFPWGRLAYTVVGTPLESYARLVGVPATSAIVFLVAVFAACIANSKSMRGRLGYAAVTGLVFAVGVVLPTGISGPAGSRTVALVQGDVPVLFAPWPRGEIFAMHLAQTQRLVDAINAGDEPAPDLVLWPENSLDVDPYNERGASERIENMSRQLNAPILIGAILDGPTADTAYNAGVVWNASGPTDRYVKRRVVPFGEYVPFRPVLGWLVGRFDREVPRDMLGGTEHGAIDIAGIRIGDTLCWDIAYDSVVRDAITNGAQFLVVQTSNASFTGTAQPEQQWQISTLRAIETGRTVVVPSTNGISGIINATGKVTARAESQTATHLSKRVTLGAGITPGVRWGGWIQLTLVLAGGVGLMLRAANLSPPSVVHRVLSRCKVKLASAITRIVS